MKKRFIVDLNLPKNLSFFQSPEFVFVADMNERMTDSDIWNYALSNDLIILSRDTDFYSRALVSKRKPKVVFFKLGNILFKDMEKYFEKHWNEIALLLDSHFLVVAEKKGIDILI